MCPFALHQIPPIKKFGLQCQYDLWSLLDARALLVKYLAYLQIACWGNGDQGRLGLGKAAASSVPCLVGALTDALFTVVSCGGAHTAAVAEDGSAYLWGLNDRGQLAQGDETPFLQVWILKCQMCSRNAGSRVGCNTNDCAVSPSAYHCIVAQSAGRSSLWHMQVPKEALVPEAIVQVGFTFFRAPSCLVQLLAGWLTSY